MTKYLKTYCALVILCLTLSMTTSLIYTTALAKDATVQAVVEGEGYKLNQAINVSADTTQEFEERYGVHAPVDMVLSELMIVLLEAFILFVLVVMYGNFFRKQKSSPVKNNKKHSNTLYSMSRLKKIAPFVLIIALFAQLLPGLPLIQEASANVVYDDPFESGDIFLTEFDFGGDIIKLNASAATPFADEVMYTEASGGPTGVLFLPTGDLVRFALVDLGGSNYANRVYCYTLASNYTQQCSWSPYTYQDTTYSPADGEGLHFPTRGVVAPNGDIWLLHALRTSDFGYRGDFVSRVIASSGYTTHDVFDIGDYGVCSNVTYTTKLDCVNNSATWNNFVGVDIAIDHHGDIWIPQFANFIDFSNPNMGTKVVCLDAQNSFNRCSGSGFDANGRIDIGYAPNSITVNDHNEIFVGHVYSENKITKIEASNNYTITYSSTIQQPQNMVVTPDGNIWFNRNWNNGLLTPYLIGCVTRDMTPCSNAGGAANTPTGNFGIEFATTDNPGGVFIGTHSTPGEFTIWQMVPAAGAVRVYCFDSANSYMGCAQTGSLYDGYTEFTNSDSENTDVSYLTVPTNFNASTDPTGYKIKALMDVVAGQGQVTVTATIDPTISLALSSNSCNLGTLDTNSVATCTYDVSTATNATDGITVFATASSAALVGPSGDIDACSGTDCDGKGTTAVNAGQEEYGFYVSTANHTVAGSYATQHQATPTSSTTLLTVAEPHDTTSSTVTHAASIDDLTPAGAYSHTITWTAVGSF